MVKTMSSVNHALVTWFWFINQTWVSVFLGIKNTEVQTYRTDPVQVRSCWFTSVPCLYHGYHLYWQPMWDKSICSLSSLNSQNKTIKYKNEKKKKFVQSL
ncbi:hypothetical protein HanPSC8_Chr17g0792881 [Helianthus annuus]|nr:hypothetical protein HanPSC8_Chr17g0792881 [Helianthus annuus]